MKTRPHLLTTLDILTAISLLAGTGLVFFYAPLEAVMGPVQKIFYFHVGANWAGMASFMVAAVCGAALLRSGKLSWDLAAVAAVEVGMLFTFIGILTGMLWAKPTWNTWWTWDPRLTTITIMELAYAAYLLLRQGIEDPGRRARFSAVYALAAFISVPLTFFSIRLARTIHPILIAGSDPTSQAFDMTPKMTVTFLFSLAAFTLLLADLLWRRIRLGWLAAQAEAQREEETL